MGNWFTAILIQYLEVLLEKQKVLMSRAQNWFQAEVLFTIKGSRIVTKSGLGDKKMLNHPKDAKSLFPSVVWKYISNSSLIYDRA